MAELIRIRSDKRPKALGASVETPLWDIISCTTIPPFSLKNSGNISIVSYGGTGLRLATKNNENGILGASSTGNNGSVIDLPLIGTMSKGWILVRFIVNGASPQVQDFFTHSDSANGNRLYFGMLMNQSLFARLGSSAVNSTFGVTLSYGRTYSAAISWESGTIYAFLDGVALSTSSYTGTPGSSSARTSLAGNHNGTLSVSCLNGVLFLCAVGEERPSDSFLINATTNPYKTLFRPQPSRFILIPSGALSVTQDGLLRWNLISATQQDSSLRWDVRVSTENDTLIRWNTLEGILSDTVLRWDALSSIQQDSLIRWNSLSLVQQDNLLRWNGLTSAQQDSLLRWNALNSTQQDSSIRWDILSSILSAQNDATLRWDTLNSIQQEILLRWNLAQAIEQSLNTRWNLLNAAEISQSLRWDIAIAVANDLVARWDIQNLGSAFADLSVRWNSFAVSENTIELRWQIGDSSETPGIRIFLVRGEDRVFHLLSQDRIFNL